MIEEISLNLQEGDDDAVEELVQQALDEGVDPKKILDEALLDGMSIIGELFKNNEVFVPEVLVAARAFDAGVAVLKPYLKEGDTAAKGTVCIGTIKGDLHDIGKNLVKLMMESKGLKVIDLGTDVPPEKFISTAKDNHCDIIACSALLTTTMGNMKEVARLMKEEGLNNVKLMIGGAPITDAFCRMIGADVFTLDAASAAEAAVEICAANQ